MMYDFDGMMGGGGMVWAWLIWLLVLINLVLLAVFLWQKISKK